MTIDRKFIDYDFSIVPADQSRGLIEQPPAELLGSFAGIPWYDEIAGGDEMVNAATSDLQEAILAELSDRAAKSSGDVWQEAFDEALSV